jgi:hypothetical protein
MRVSKKKVRASCKEGCGTHGRYLMMTRLAAFGRNRDKKRAMMEFKESHGQSLMSWVSSTGGAHPRLPTGAD